MEPAANRQGAGYERFERAVTVNRGAGSLEPALSRQVLSGRPRPQLCRFSAAGNDSLTTRYGELRTLDVEHSELVSLTDADMTAKKVIVTKNYAGEYTVEFPDQPDLFGKRVHPAEIDQVCAKFDVPSTEVGEAFFRASDECIAEAKQAAQQGRFAELAALAAPHREKLEFQRPLRAW